MAVLVSMGFLGAWTPYAAVSFWSIFHSSASIPHFVSLLPCLFAKSSTAYNPLIYYAFSKTFRREVKQLRCCHSRQLHFFNTKDSTENHVSATWSGRGNVRIYSIKRTNNEVPNQQAASIALFENAALKSSSPQCIEKLYRRSQSSDIVQ